MLQICKDYIIFSKNVPCAFRLRNLNEGLGICKPWFSIKFYLQAMFACVWTIFCSYCFSPFRILYQNTIDSVAYKLKLTAQSSAGWQVWDLDAGRFCVWWGPASWFIDIFTLCPLMTWHKKLSGISILIRTLFMRALSLWPSHLPKVSMSKYHHFWD